MVTVRLQCNRLARLIRWRTLPLLCILFLSSKVLAQARLGQLRDDHLQPVTNYFSAYHYQDEYYSSIRRYLLDSLRNSPVARVIVQPSFSVEYVVSVDSVNKTYFLRYSRMNKSIWSTKQKESLRAITTKTTIGEPLAKALNKLFFKALAQTRYPKRVFLKGLNGEEFEDISVGTDGTTYVFTAFGYGRGVRSGETWSPREGSFMNELVNISNALITLTANTMNREVGERTLLDQCQTLYKRIAEPR